MYYYCERIDSGFWSEPINATTNIAFIAVAFIFFFNYRNSNLARNCAYLITSIGIGSFLFHTIPNNITGMLDTLSIALLVMYYIYNINPYIFKMHRYFSILIVIAFPIVCIVFGSALKNSFIGYSAFYVPILLYLILLSILLWLKDNPMRKGMIITSLVFTLSICMRILDFKVCHIVPYGTHFIWHILNSITIYFAVKSLVQIKLLNDGTSPKIPT